MSFAHTVKSQSVCIIDPNEADRSLYRQLLDQDHRYHYDIVEFDTAQAGLEYCLQQTPTLILLDFILPDANGLEFLEQLQNSNSTKKMPVIILTGQGDENIAVQLMKSGAQDYLVKGKLTREAFYRACNTVRERMQLMQQLEQQQEQQRLLGAIALRIRQSLSLEVVLKTAVDEVRKFLKADRVLVYQLHPDMSGNVVAESVLPGWTSCLNLYLQDICLIRNFSTGYDQKYRLAVANIHTAGLSQCYVQMLESFQVKAKMVVPIFSYTQQSEGLNADCLPWGLLIAHQCSSPRQWEQSEIELLDQLSVQMAIAIQQAELYQNLQTLNTQLEAKVEERTTELQASERKFRAIFEQNFQFISLLMPDGILVEVNQAPIDFVGAKRSDFIGKFFWETPTWNHFPQLKQRLQTAIAEARAGKLVRYEVNLPNLAGVVKTFDFSIKPIRDDHGSVIFLLAESRDITEGKQAAAALQKLNQQLELRVERRTSDLAQANSKLRQEIAQRQIIEATVLQLQQRLEFLIFSSPGAIYTSKISTNHETTFISGNVKTLFGYDAAEFTTNASFWLDRVHPEDKNWVLGEMTQLLERDRVNVEYRFLNKNRIYRWVFDQASLVRDEQGNPVEAIGYWLDISDRKQAELEIIQNRDLREAIFNESADAIFLVDPKSLLIIDCNQQAVELFEAVSKTELINTEGYRLQKYQFTPEEQQEIAQEMKRQGFWSREIEYVTLKGNLFWGNLAVKQISVALKAMNLVRVSDISDRKRSEEQIRRSLDEKETLLKEIHHRVKNNLQIISSLLRMQSRRPLDEATSILFQESQNRVQSMALIHEQLYQSPDLSQIDFQNYISKLTDNLFRSYGISQRVISLVIETNHINLPLDTAIPCGLIINELVSNSLKYAFRRGQKGKIIINLQLARDNTVALTVGDNGIGIPETLNWENSHTLGLRIVHNLTRQLKGKITLERDRGTTFHITFANTKKH